MLALDTMTWRRFRVLLKCLSPQSATLTRMSSEKYIGGAPHERAHVVSGPKAAEAAFQAAFKK